MGSNPVGSWICSVGFLPQDLIIFRSFHRNLTHMIYFHIFAIANKVLLEIRTCAPSFIDAEHYQTNPPIYNLILSMRYIFADH